MESSPERARVVGLAVVAWVVVVAVGSGLVWAVVSGAGREVTGAGEVPTAPSAPTVPTGSSGATDGSTGPSRDPAPARSRTWSGAAGVVTTRCVGTRISLVRALPSADGYVVEIEERGPRRVRVELEGRGGESGLETRVEARCAAGVPRYEVDVRD